MNEDDFWRAVGERLAERRRKEGASVVAIGANGGPTNKTIQDIEAGNIRQLAKLREYANAMDVDLVDLFRSVLQGNDEDQTEELQFVIRQFKGTGVKGRAALVATAMLAEEKSEPLLPGAPSGRAETPRETPPVKSAVVKRRGRAR